MTKAETPLFIVNVEGVVRRETRYLLTVRSDAEPHAPGTLALPGGKLEPTDPQTASLEATLTRELLEETGVRAENFRYLESKWFLTDDGEAVADVVFLCDYAGGELRVGDPDEIAEVLWLTAAEVMAHPKAPPWTRATVEKAEQLRL